jgi:dipeptidyl aminopeptidase/acylaminoacyl peptidase
VVYTVRSTEWKENRFKNEVWLARDGAAPIQLTRTAKGGSTAPQWSPDGAWIAFLSDRAERNQIYLISPMGGEAVQLTRHGTAVGNFSWSPDGKAIAFTAPEPESDQMKQRKEKYGDFAIEDADWTMSHLWLVEVNPSAAPADAKRLTEGSSFTVGSFAWSPDGARIAYDHRSDPSVNSWISADISLLTVASKAVTPLVTLRGSDAGPVWSPDGQWLLYTTSGGDTVSNFYRNNRLMKIPVSGGTATRLAADFDEQIGGVTWTAGGVYFVGFNKTRRYVNRIDPVNGAVERLGEPPVLVFGLDLTPDGRTMAFSGQTAAGLSEIYLAPVPAPGAAFPQGRKLTAMSAQLASWPLGTAEVVSWKSRDGATIEGVLHKPRDFRPGQRYPLLVVIHGGPTGIDLPLQSTGGVYPITQWVAQGALVLRPNYRGSAGYGEAFRSLNVRNLGVGDMWDVMTGVDHLVKQGIVDTARMGSMGWSQGGYISAFLTTNTDRFKAISVGAGISNWVTYYVSTDIHPFTRQYLKANPWVDPAIYARTSPMTTIRQARTPTLIQHGEFDRRVPIQNAYELFQGLQDVGVPARLIVYKGFGHGITKPKEQLAAMQHNWEWFGQYVFGRAAVAGN